MLRQHRFHFWLDFSIFSYDFCNDYFCKLYYSHLYKLFCSFIRWVLWLWILTLFVAASLGVNTVFKLKIWQFCLHQLKYPFIWIINGPSCMLRYSFMTAQQIQVPRGLSGDLNLWPSDNRLTFFNLWSVTPLGSFKGLIFVKYFKCLCIFSTIVTH